MGTEITMDSIISQIEEIVASEIDGETVMMSIENGEYYGLDLVGSEIWKHLGSPFKVADLIDALLAKYDIDRETCKKDVLVFLNELSGNKIIQVKN